MEDIARDIYAELGPGFSERVYHNAFEVCLRMKGIPYETERVIPIIFRGHTIGTVRADIIVDGHTVIEFKAVKALKDATDLQAGNYMKLTGIRKAYLVNFPPCPQKACEIKVVVLE